MAKKSRPSLVNKSKESIVATPATSEIKEKVKAHKVQTKSLKTKFSSKSKGKSLELPKIVEKPTVNEMLAQYEYFLQAICDHEKNSIQEILIELKEQNPKNQLALDEFGKELQNYLDDFMNKFHKQYPKANEGNENHPLVFLPEFSSQEFETLKHQQKQLQVQTQFLEVLNQYEQDLNLLRLNENLWIGKVPAQEHDITVSEHVVGTSQRYLEILNSMEQSCDKILDVCNATKKQMHQSRDLQDQLYDNFESLRESMTLTEKPSNHIPKDAKDLLKGFPKYLK